MVMSTKHSSPQVMVPRRPLCKDWRFMPKTGRSSSTVEPPLTCWEEPLCLKGKGDETKYSGHAGLKWYYGLGLASKSPHKRSLAFISGYTCLKILRPHHRWDGSAMSLVFPIRGRRVGQSLQQGKEVLNVASTSPSL